MSLVEQTIARIEKAEADAVKGCGQSDVLYESRVQGAYEAILESASSEDRPVVERLLIQRGYDPDPQPYMSGPDECSLTGIDTDCCPCGRHP